MSNKSSRFQQPLRLELKPSRYLRVALVALAIVACAAIFYSALDWRWRALGALLIALHLSVLLRRYAQAPGCLYWRGEHWLWSGSLNNECVLHLQQATLWPGFIQLRFSDETGRTHFFTLLNDSLDVDTRRRLRASVRHLPVFAERAAINNRDA